MAVLLVSEVDAQCGAGFPYASNGGRFSVSQIRGCAGLTVDICISEPTCDCVNSCTCDIIFGDGSGNDTFSYSYNTTGTYRLEVIFPNPTPSDFIDIVVTDNEAPNFDVFSCSGNTARIDVQDNQYDNYAIDFGDGTSILVPTGGANPQHTYANSTPRTISVQGVDNNALDNCPVATTNFTPINLLPNLTIEQLNILNESDLELVYSADENISYRLEIQVNGNGNFNFIKNITPETSPDTILNLDLVNNFYCFRIGSVDPCINSITYSNTICSISALLRIRNSNNAVSWVTNNPSTNFNLVRQVENENGTSTLNPYLTFNNLTRSFNDTDIICNSQYCYFLQAEYGGGISTSNEVCGLSVSTNPPDSVSDLSIRVSDAETLLDWPDDVNLIDNYEIRSFSSFLGTSQVTDYTDISGSANAQSTCYTIVTNDNCGNTNSTDEICSLFLSGTISSSNVIDLTWNEYSGYQNGVNTYEIEKYYGLNLVNTQQQLGNIYSEEDMNQNEQVINYRIIALPTASNLPATTSNLITIIKPNNIHYPTAFTPDNNGTNETFSVNGQYFTSYKMKIFNRWGELIFTSESPENGWDGTYNNQPQQVGTYVFNLEARDLAERQIKESGSFVLLRR